MKASGKVKHIHQQRYDFALICLCNIFLLAGQTEALECTPSFSPALLLFLSVNNYLEQGHFDLLPQ